VEHKFLAHTSPETKAKRKKMVWLYTGLARR